jgi:hypothetical protein
MSDPAGGLLWPPPFPPLAEMLAYWQRKRGTRRCLGKADIDISGSPLAVRKAGGAGFGIDLDRMAPAPIPYPPDIVALSSPDYVWAWGAQA